MNHGVIEQVGAPAEIYRAPATPFVAEFVGTMNFLRGRLVSEGRVEIGGIAIAVEGAEGLAPGSDVVLCLRPEDIGVRNLAAGAPNVVPAQISELEFLGPFCRARLDAPSLKNGALVADFSSNAVRDLGLAPGQTLSVALPPDRLRIFAA
jgi:iron(III) transport system ATP-binding protein